MLKTGGHWRDVLDHAERVPYEITLPMLQNTHMCGVNGADLSADLWSFLLKWIGPTLYTRRMHIGLNIEGNGLELWRKLFTQYHGSDELLQVAGRTRLQDFPQCKHLKSLDNHIDEWLHLFYEYGSDIGPQSAQVMFFAHIA